LEFIGVFLFYWKNCKAIVVFLLALGGEHEYFFGSLGVGVLIESLGGHCQLGGTLRGVYGLFPNNNEPHWMKPFIKKLLLWIFCLNSTW
jgi:hypothetical protein